MAGQKAWTVIEEAAAKQQVPRADVLSSLQQLEKEAQAAGLTGGLRLLCSNESMRLGNWGNFAELLVSLASSQ